MTQHGGSGGEPTSYGLQPPAAGPAGAPAAYEPTQAVPGPRAEDGAHRMLGGRYRLGSRLGHGGMGTVWRAHDEVVDREVAVKEPRVPENLSAQERETAYQRMRREARSAARIDHPSVVTVHDVVVEDGRPWIVMELVNGRSLADVLAEGTLSARETARIGLAVLGALGAAHEAGVLHRDVKPENVLLGRHDRVVLTDFGIAQVEGEQRLTETGAFVGSPEFIAPERVLGQQPGPQSDLWSLGVVLYAALEGVSPFRRSNTAATLQAVLSAEPQLPSRTPDPLATAVMQVLRKDPDARPRLTELRQVLDEAARPAPLRATMPATATGLGRATRAYRRRLRASRMVQLVTAVGVLAVAVAVVLPFADPFADRGVPDGWQVRDETKQVRASLAVPQEYVRSEDEGMVTYTSRDEDFYIELARFPDATEGPVGSANEALDAYETGYAYQNVDGTVTSDTYRGEDAALLDATYNPTEFPNRERHVREFVYINGNATEWQLELHAPDHTREMRGKAKEMFDDLVANLDIHRS